jgi:hypothetical protein
LCRHLPEVLIARAAVDHGLRKWELLAVVQSSSRNGIRTSRAFSPSLPTQQGAPNRFTRLTRS